jgi:large subunit ribosomal protein L15
MPLVRRVPKRGFNNRFALKVAVLNVRDLERVFDAGAEVNRETIKKTPLLGHRYDLLKILGEGELTKPLTVSAHRFSQTAVEKIERAGGTVIRLPGPTPVEEKKQRAADPN